MEFAIEYAEQLLRVEWGQHMKFGLSEVGKPSAAILG